MALGPIGPRVFKSIKELKIWKKLQLSDDILRLFYYIRNPIYGLVWLQLATKAKIHVITKALNRPPRDLT